VLGTAELNNSNVEFLLCVSPFSFSFSSPSPSHSPPKFLVVLSSPLSPSCVSRPHRYRRRHPHAPVLFVTLFRVGKHLQSVNMAPSVVIDNDSDFTPILPKASFFHPRTRTLLLAPPSISSHEENLRNVLALHDRAITDLQMLDRLSAGLVTLPDSAYDLILILTDADGTRTESSQLLGRDVFGRIAAALKAGGKLQTQDSTLGRDVAAPELQEGILAGLIVDGSGMTKPDYGADETVPLRLRRKEKNGGISRPGPLVAAAAIQLDGKRKSVDITKGKTAGVGFVDFSDDFGSSMDTGADDDDDLIDEDTLLTEEDLKRPVNIRKSSNPPIFLIC
jgi:anamorsin